MLVFCLFFLLFIIEKSIIRQNEFALGKLNRLSDAEENLPTVLTIHVIMEARTQLVRDSRWSGVKGELTDPKALCREVENAFREN